MTMNPPVAAPNGEAGSVTTSRRVGLVSDAL